MTNQKLFEAAQAFAEAQEVILNAQRKVISASVRDLSALSEAEKALEEAKKKSIVLYLEWQRLNELSEKCGQLPDTQQTPNHIPDATKMVHADVDHFVDANKKPDSHGWMPIETAPKDGQWVLTFDPSFEKIAPGCGVKTNRVMQGFPSGSNIPWQEHQNPTHWQPLPPAPEVK